MADNLKVPEAFYSLFAVARMLGVPKGTVAQFSKENPPTELAPIAHLFICFEEDGRQAWAIRKSHFNKWRQTGKAPKVSTGRPPRWKNNPDYVNINIPVPKKLYDKFKSVVDKGNALSSVRYSYRDMIYAAMQEFIDRRPNLQ